ncbi:MAG: DNA translocase FtsK [Myxococcota bacterium]|nr:DNA translocase FtsK [Myxococcota bacterium]
MNTAAPRTPPFEDHFVVDPRRIEDPAGDLNNAALERLIDDFHRILSGELLNFARLVLSPQHGFGKSHLIGRLFHRLEQEAVCVYLSPFSDPALAWMSVLERTVQTLDRDDHIAALAAHVFHVLAGLWIQREGKALATEYERLSAALQAQQAELDEWFAFIEDHAMEDFPALLLRQGVDLAPSNRAWLQVLLSYLQFDAESNSRAQCVDWMRARPIALSHRRLLDLRGNELVPDDASLRTLDGLARARLSALCRLARFFRPMLFCFDQTESYGHEPALARCFGHMLSELVCSTDARGELFPSHLTIVTANQVDWTETLLPHMVRAEAQRLHPESPVVLQSIQRKQAELLIQSRLRRNGETEEAIDAFLSLPWLDQYFGPGTLDLGARELIIACRAQWSAFSSEQGGSTSHAELEQRFERMRRSALEEPTSLLFERELLSWFVRELGLVGTRMRYAEQRQARYFVDVWRGPAFEVHFCIDGSNHWRRWDAIAKDARALCAEERKRAVALRTPELDALPGNWQNAEAFRQSLDAGLEVLVLERAQLAALLAARRLSLALEEGALPGLTLAELQQFLAPFFEDLRARILSGLQAKGREAFAAREASPSPAAEPIRHSVPLPGVGSHGLRSKTPPSAPGGVRHEREEPAPAVKPRSAAESKLHSMEAPRTTLQREPSGKEAGAQRIVTRPVPAAQMSMRSSLHVGAQAQDGPSDPSGLSGRTLLSRQGQAERAPEAQDSAPPRPKKHWERQDTSVDEHRSGPALSAWDHPLFDEDEHTTEMPIVNADGRESPHEVDGFEEEPRTAPQQPARLLKRRQATRVQEAKQSWTVTELWGLCQSPSRRAEVLNDAAPSSLDEATGASASALGQAFHRAVELLVKLLIAGRGPSVDTGADALHAFARRAVLPKSLGQIAGPDTQLIDAAVRAFVEHIVDLAGALNGIQDWGQLFVASEKSLVARFGPPEHSIEIRGRVDVLRRRADGRLDLVDYKLLDAEPERRGPWQGEDALQLAMYACLFEHPAEIAEGLLEVYSPQLQTQAFEMSALQALFASRVQPVLEALAGMTQGPSATKEEPPTPDVLQLSEAIVKVLASFGATVSTKEPIVGPQVIRFRVVPAAGTQASRIGTHADDLRVQLNLPSKPLVRVAPGCLHIDIPRKPRHFVDWDELMALAPAPDPRCWVPVGLSIDREVIGAELSGSECHLLVAGMTGSGKSEFLKSLVASLAARHTPETLRLVLVDPKRVSFGTIKDSPFLNAPVVYESEEAVGLFEAGVEEMERRYEAMEELGVEHVQAARERGAEWPRVVMVVDEYADLLQQANKSLALRFSNAVTRLAQKGRACGLHLVLATQHPTMGVVAPFIKNNLPFKVALRVASGDASRVILSRVGAENLLGLGDFLVPRPGMELLRGQAPLISTERLSEVLGWK